MNESPKPGNGSSSDSDDAAAKVAVARRRMLRGVAGAAPVLMTLHSRPVMAGICATASASASLNPSGIRRAKGKAFDCTGALKPAEWLLEGQQWPNGVAKNSAKFSDFFDTLPPGANNGTKLTQVLEFSETTGVKALAKVCAATLLNNKAGFVPDGFFGGGTYKTVWEHGSTGTFSPRIGATWSVDKVAQWLATTWGEPWLPWYGHPESP